MFLILKIKYTQLLSQFYYNYYSQGIILVIKTSILRRIQIFQQSELLLSVPYNSAYTI